MKVDLPGVEPTSIDLTVDRNVLRIDASRDWRPAEGDLVLAAERPRGGFSRQLVLSEDIDTTAIQADYRDGVLSVVLPVAATARPRKVAISTGDGSSPTTVEAQATGPRAAGREQADLLVIGQALPVARAEPAQGRLQIRLLSGDMAAPDPSPNVP